jgi:Sec-independent protein translocase protein TatA
MGIPELGVILLVAFLVLGPGRAIDTARNVGKVLGDLRRSFGDVTSAMTMESTEQRSPAQIREPEPPPGVPMRAEIPPEDEPDAPERPADENGESEGKG